MRTKGTILALLTLAATSAPGRGAISGAASQAPLLATAAGPISSDNVSLAATIPVTGATGGRFAGGYFFTTASGTVPLTAGPTAGLYIFSAANPTMPKLEGFLPLPHTENEDVDVSVSRKLALVSQDSIQSGVAGGRLYVISWANPALPALLATIPYPLSVPRGDGRSGRGPGHIANCIADCARYAWITGAGNGSIFVVDLANPAAPFLVPGSIPASVNKAGAPNDAFTGGDVHDINVDSSGYAWATGSGGTAQLDVTNPTAPLALRWIAPSANEAQNQFIHHNSTRLDATTVLVTEEDWLQPQCGSGFTGQQGAFQTWRINSGTGSGALSFLDGWVTELNNYLGGSAPAEVLCSSHWFTVSAAKVAAVGWYNQGVRFLDVSNASDIRQVGYFIAPGTMASAAYYVPGHSDVVWVADYFRGIDVLRIGAGAGSPTVVAPVLAEWLRPLHEVASLEPSRVWGFACLVRPGSEDGQIFGGAGRQERASTAPNDSGVRGNTWRVSDFLS